MSRLPVRRTLGGTIALGLVGTHARCRRRRRRRAAPWRGRPARATSTPRRAPRAWPRTARRARCTRLQRLLYQVRRQSDGATKDIGVVQPTDSDPGGYADAAAQDAFCANTVCWITTLYDQSGNAQQPHPGAPRRVQRPGAGRVQQPADRGHGADHGRRPQGLRRLHRAWHGATRQQRHRHRGRTTSPRDRTGWSTAATTTTAAASTTATPRPTAATTATARWRPRTSATRPRGTTAPPPARGS